MSNMAWRGFKMKLIPLITLLLLILPIALSLSSTECTNVEALNYAKQARCDLDTVILSEINTMTKTNDVMIKEVFDATGRQEITTGQAQELFNFFYYIFWALFVLGVTYTGYLFMLNSASPAKRLAAKKQLKNIFIIGILIVALPLIIHETNSLSNNLSTYIYDETINEDYFTFDSFTPESGTGLEQDIEIKGTLEATTSFFQSGAMAYLVSANARNIILLTLISLSPIILLLFFFIPTQEYGKMLAALFFIEYFIPSVYMGIFSFAETIAGTGSTLEIEAQKIVVLSSALIFATILHLAIVAIAVLKSVHSSRMEVRDES